MDINTALRAFVRTVEKGSVTGAARDLAISQPAVTKHLRNLERHVNARLLERSSKTVRPTAHGMTLYEVSRNALASIDAAMEGVRRDMGEIEGNLRVHAPSCLGAQHLHGMIMLFQDDHPAVTVDLVLDNRNVDLIYENFDLAVRYGKIVSQEVIARRIGWIQRILVASPDYIKRAGPIETLERIAECDMVATTTIFSPRDSLTLCHGDDTIEINVRPVLKTNSAQVLTTSLLAGRGIGPAQVNLVSRELAEGLLVRVLPDYAVKPTEVFLTYPSTKFMRPVVRAFTDFIVPKLRSVEGITT
ncbi:DNA-binding transcriptional regulator, LysR family [Phyllobacterium sp. YR620]|uniref:LysR family transcriptional regulator n=1 Tax=Phyllobacterium sp. YR620 TaxID=1881066 RepID=UPI000891E7DD|nr:LysR family transcriptional regulator [Phyllobacterium sp. YR620]SDP68525.1 DNA-binding transcriptional regulator, LysR family [Phyllobacterium sp. YR620]